MAARREQLCRNVGPLARRFAKRETSRFRRRKVKTAEGGGRIKLGFQGYW